MIRRLRHSEIDFLRYQKCLETSVEQNFYAQPLVLNHLCPQWELLVKNDYEFVMPVPVRRKYGFKFAIMPLFCQQLGISGPSVDFSVHDEFLSFLQGNYRVAYYAFHYSNRFSISLNQRKNYCIAPNSYPQQYRSYLKGRKSAVKSAQDLHLLRPQLEDVLLFIKKHIKGLDKKTDSEKFFTYLNYLNSHKILSLYGAANDGVLITLAVTISTHNRLALLQLVNNEEFRSNNGASFIIDQLLRDHLATHTFDFMGSSIRGIEIFFKSFGSELQPYSVIQNGAKDLLKNLFKTS